MSVMRFEPFADPFRAFDRLTSQLVSGRRTVPPRRLEVQHGGGPQKLETGQPSS